MPLLASLEAWQAVLLGIVEGLTEFLPISSTGHLLLTQRLLGLGRTPALEVFVVVVQVGAILAVIGLYRARALSLVRGLLGRDEAGARLLGRLLLAFLPAVGFGLLVEGPVERRLHGLWPITVAWALGGLLLLALARRRAPQAAGEEARAPGLSLEALSLRGALLVGLFQCAALLPGTSRSLVTMVGGIVVGLSLAAAVEFSFLLGVLTLAAAAAWKLLTTGADLETGLGGSTLALGCLAAALAAAVSVRFLARWTDRHGVAAFGWYRLALAAVVCVLLLSGAWTAT